MPRRVHGPGDPRQRSGRGGNVPADQILEAFQPGFALRVWNAHKPAGTPLDTLPDSHRGVAKADFEPDAN